MELSRTVQAIATYANVQMNYAKGGDFFASMALQPTHASVSQKGQSSNQVAERMLVLLSQQTRQRFTAQRGERDLNIVRILTFSPGSSYQDFHASS